MTVPYPIIYRANATSRVKCQGERKVRGIRYNIKLTESLFNLPEESLDQYVRFAYINGIAGRHSGEEVYYNKENGYLIDGVEYWSEE